MFTERGITDRRNGSGGITGQDCVKNQVVDD